MAEGKLVDAAGYISDESSFYGSPSLKAEWEESLHATTLPAIDPFKLNRSLPQPTTKPSDAASTSPAPDAKLYDYYAGIPCGRQLSESVPDFLARLPPSTTKRESINEWIWVKNPYLPLNETNIDVAGFKEAGIDILAAFKTEEWHIMETMKTKGYAVQQQEIGKQRKEAERKLLEAAVECGVTAGKWMLFPDVKNVDGDWAKVVEAMVKGKLGTTAKVAPDEGMGEKKARLICVYTRDFKDKRDVKRVLKELLGLEIASKGDARGIYYKCDAYTYLDIGGRNEWGIKASMYSSKELKKEM